MRQRQRKLCLDVDAVRSADCWTDHKVLCTKIRMKVTHKPSASKIRPRFAVSSLREAEVRERYSKAAEVVLGQERRRQPDWFLDNIQTLGALITKRNTFFARWLKIHCPRDQQRYVMQRREVAREVKHGKNAWFQKRACEVELAVKRGRGAWKRLREMQWGRAGLRPVRPHVIKDLDGRLCIGHDNTFQRWHQYFNAVLNVPSSFDVRVIDAVEQRQERTELAYLPTEEEVEEALGKLEGGGGGGGGQGRWK